MTSNNAVILLKAQTYGPVKKGETLVYKERPYEFPEPGKGEIIVKALYLSVDPYLVANPPSMRLTNRERKSEIRRWNLSPRYPANCQPLQSLADELQSPSKSVTRFTVSGSGSSTNPTTPTFRKAQSLIQPWIGQSTLISRLQMIA
jgi:hypothetical protein